MPVPIYQVDAFTREPFQGNPAAVCLLDAPRSDAWMQNVAREMNLSETAFLQAQEDGFSLRWFTPAVEVDLCGHATLASAHTLWETGTLPAGKQARFFTRSGLLTAERSGDWIGLDLPLIAPATAQAPSGLAAALGANPLAVLQAGPDLMVELESEQTVRALQPDLTALLRLPLRGLIVTAQAAKAGFDFVSRFFGPWVGVPEDPATGSAHCALGPFWAPRLGKSEMAAYQASARGGVLRVVVGRERVRVSGQAVTVLRGELLAN